MVCRYDGRLRELCPHIIGTNRSGEEVRCRGAGSSPVRRWRSGATAQTEAVASHEQTCVSAIDLDINICAQALLRGGECACAFRENSSAASSVICPVQSSHEKYSA